MTKNPHNDLSQVCASLRDQKRQHVNIRMCPIYFLLRTAYKALEVFTLMIGNISGLFTVWLQNYVATGDWPPNFIRNNDIGMQACF
jgi:hypothetical protein